MPSSDPQTIGRVLKLVTWLSPSSILDIGSGNGRYGFLFRECLDWNYGRLAKNDWGIRIDALEVDEEYLTSVHDYVYTNIFLNEWLKFTPRIYDIAFMGDVLEHFSDWKAALDLAQRHSKITIVVSPNWPGSIEQRAWHGHEYEDHKVALSPAMVGGRCVFANSKTFICVFDNMASGVFDGKDFLL